MPVAEAQRLVAHAQDYGCCHLTFPYTEMIEERRMVAYARDKDGLRRNNTVMSF